MDPVERLPKKFRCADVHTEWGGVQRMRRPVLHLSIKRIIVRRYTGASARRALYFFSHKPIDARTDCLEPPETRPFDVTIVALISSSSFLFSSLVVDTSPCEYLKPGCGACGILLIAMMYSLKLIVPSPSSS